MKYNFEKTSNVTAELTVTIEKADIEPKVAKAMKELRVKAQMPGFRRGQVPMSIISKRFGMEVRQEEVQKLLGQAIYDYLRTENVKSLGDPLGSEKQPPVDFAADEMSFVFDVALAPEFDAKLSEADTIPYYNIEVTDEMVNQDINAYTAQGGHHEKVESYQNGDMVKGHLAELDADGNIKEGGLQKEDAVLLPSYMKNDEMKAKFEGLTPNTVITINPSEAYNGSPIEVATLLGIDRDAAADVKSDFSLQVSEITRYVPADLDQDLFDRVLGEGKVTTEQEFRAAIREQIEGRLATNSKMRFITDVREYLFGRIGEVQWPEEMMKRIMRATSKDRTDEDIDKNWADTLRGLEWHLIKEQLADQTGIKVEQADVVEQAKAETRMQFAQYGMGYAPEDLVERYANQMLGQREQQERLVDRAVDNKLEEALMSVVTLDKKTVSLADFNKLYE